LDLVLTDDDFINTIDYLSPLGKSDYSVLSVKCNFKASNKTFGKQFNYSKGDYVNLCKFMDFDWNQSLTNCTDIEAMWTHFKDRLVDGIMQYIPKISNFYDWRKPLWKCPLSPNTRAKITNNTYVVEAVHNDT